MDKSLLIKLLKTLPLYTCRIKLVTILKNVKPVSVIAIERGYIDLHNTYYGLTRINPEERRILEKLGCTISPAEFVTI